MKAIITKPPQNNSERRSIIIGKMDHRHSDYQSSFPRPPCYPPRMPRLRLLCLAPLPLLASCSALIQESGRDPMKLVGRSQASIHAEFGKPLKTEHPHVYYDTEETFHVTGKWSNELGTMGYTLGTLFTAGALEPFYTVQSAYFKSRDNSQGMHLVVSYHDRVVKRAEAKSIDRNASATASHL